MAQVHPFRAFRYNPARAAFDRVLTQPYDKISPAMQQKYYAADPHNLIIIEKGRVFPSDSAQNDVYTRAGAALEDWIHNNIVAEDPVPSFYGYSQEYLVPSTNERRTRRGFIGVGKLEDYSAGIVFRHEQTLSGPKADRLELLRHTRTHTGQLFMLYSDAERRVDGILAEAESSAAPATELRDEYGVVHRLWVIADENRVAAIAQAMADQKLVIADGHHRYETALNYRNERRSQAGHVDPDAAYEFAMMTFINTRSEGLTILPTHRVAANRLAERRAQRSIGVYPVAQEAKRAYYVLTLRAGADLAQLLPNVSPLQRELDVVLLHEGILEPALGITPQAVTSEKNLTYEREAAAALEAVDTGAAQIAFLLNACDVEQVMRIATAGEVLPQKSTDFYPKLLSGITMYRVEDRPK